MQDRFITRLNRLTRLGRIVLCGLVVLMVMPLLSSFLTLVPLLVIALALYGGGWFFWIGFGAQLPPVRTGAMLYILVGVGALLLWVLYNLVLLILLATSG